MPSSLIRHSLWMLLLCASAVATQPRVYDFNVRAQRHGSSAREPLAPARVYSIYLQRDRAWYFVVSDASGRIAQPLELMRAGTTLPASYFGKSEARYYGLSSKGTWSPSGESEVHYLWVLAPTPYVRVEGFRPADRLPPPRILRALAARAAKGKPLARPTPDLQKRPLAFVPDLRQWQPIPVGGGLIPSRIHCVWVPARKEWRYVISDFYGSTPRPLELLQTGSVLSGELFGLSAQERFYLSPEGRWIAIDAREKRELLQLSSPARIKAVQVVRDY